MFNTNLLFLLVLSHFVGDFLLQPSNMARFKARYEEKVFTIWIYWMLGHSAVHALLIYLLTGNIILAIVEFVIHAIIDTFKTEGITNIHMDQALHIVSKIVYVFIF